MSFPDPEFILVPLSLPSDASQILRMHHEIYSKNPMHSASRLTLPEYISTSLPSLLSRFSNPSNLTGKFVLAADPSVLCSYIVFTPPAARDTRSREQWMEDLRREIETTSNKALDKELAFRLRLEDRERSEKYLGEGWEERFWVLEALVTDEAWQRRGLGSRLVEWGMGVIEKRSREEGMGKADTPDGIMLVADLAGVSTYLKSRFEKLGERKLVGDKGGAYEHAWFVKNFRR